MAVAVTCRKATLSEAGLREVVQANSSRQLTKAPRTRRPMRKRRRRAHERTPRFIVPANERGWVGIERELDVPPRSPKGPASLIRLRLSRS